MSSPDWWVNGTKEKSIMVYGHEHYPVCPRATRSGPLCSCHAIDQDKKIAALQQALSWYAEDDWRCVQAGILEDVKQRPAYRVLTGDTKA